MPIRSAEEFKLDATRMFHPIMSPELNDVLNKLGLFHGAPATLKGQLLIDLRESLKRWEDKDNKEFRARTGPALKAEVEQEEQRRKEVSSVPKYGNLVNGDILFCWVPRNRGKLGDLLGQRGSMENKISNAQVCQDQKHKEAGFWEDGFKGINLDHSAEVVQHVGIYANDGDVIEISSCGLYQNGVEKRSHYDLVVRSLSHGKAIAAEAIEVVKAWGWQIYPIWTIDAIQKYAYPGALDLDYAETSGTLNKCDKEHEKKKHYPMQRLVCSHFVNAVLFAAVRGGTFATATDPQNDHIFKISPAQMWREFMFGQGLWGNMNAQWTGLQHKGKLNQSIDPGILEVGLHSPASHGKPLPVPK